MYSPDQQLYHILFSTSSSFNKENKIFFICISRAPLWAQNALKRDVRVWIMVLMFEVWIMKKMLPWHSSSLILDKSVHMLNLPDKIRQNFQTTLKISHFIKAVGVQKPQGARYAEKCWSIKFVWEQTNHVYIDSFIKFDRFLWTVEPQLQQTWTEEEPSPSQYSKNI